MDAIYTKELFTGGLATFLFSLLGFFMAFVIMGFTDYTRLYLNGSKPQVKEIVGTAFKEICTSTGNSKIFTLSSVILFFMALSTFGITIKAFLAISFITTLYIISVIDLDFKLILDKLSMPLLWAGLIVNYQNVFIPFELAFFGAIAGYLLLWLVATPYRLITKGTGMGNGDFKLLGAIGAWVGVLALPQVVIVAGVTSLIAMWLLKVNKRQDLYLEGIAYGPYLAFAGVMTLLLGNAFFT